MRAISCVVIALLIAAAVPASAGAPAMTPETPLVELDNLQLGPAVAYNSVRDQYLVVWENEWSGNRDIYGQRLDAAGNVLGWFAISAGMHDRVEPDVAYDWVNDRYLVVYLFDLNGDGSDYNVVGRFIDWNGPRADWPAFGICGWQSQQNDPKVVYAHTQDEFFVAWMSWTPSVSQYPSAQRVDADVTNGSLVGGSITIAADADPRGNLALAYNLARNEVIATYDRMWSGTDLDVMAARLTASGTPLGGEYPVANWVGHEYDPSIAACNTADRYLVTWTSDQPGGTTLYGWFLNGDGTTDGSPFVVAALSKASAVTVWPPTGDFLVAFEKRYAGSGNPSGVWARRFTTSGAGDSDFEVCPPAAGVERTNPAAAASEHGWLMVWEHDRSGSSYQDLHNRMAWRWLFFDHFETATTEFWSTTVP